jgi:hypothetical protein
MVGPKGVRETGGRRHAIFAIDNWPFGYSDSALGLCRC